MKCIRMYMKKLRLLKKYKQTDEKMRNDLHLAHMMKDDREFMSWFSHRRICEIRCYNRLKRL